MAQQDPSTLDAWIERIRDQEMPIFGTTAREITALAEDDHSSVSTLTQAVLQDAAMTAKLLRLANSAYFNPARSSISTVSRAARPTSSGRPIRLMPATRRVAEQRAHLMTPSVLVRLVSQTDRSQASGRPRAGLGVAADDGLAGRAARTQ